MFNPRRAVTLRRRRRQLLGGLIYLLRDEFTTTEAAPMTSPHTAEPGPGSWTITDTNNKASIASGALTFTAVSGDTVRFYSDGLSRRNGRTMVMSVTTGTAPARLDLGWAVAANNNPNGGTSVLVQLTNIINFGSSGATGYLYSAGAHTAGQTIQYALVQRSAGCFIFAKGSQFTDWTLLFVTTKDTTATLYPTLATTATTTSTNTFDYARVADLPSPLDSDYGIAVLDTTTFTQSLGAELLANGDFSAWTADDPNSWTVTGEVGADPMITEVASGGGAGTGSARFYSSATNFAPSISQAGITTSGSFYELVAIISALSSGTFYYEGNGTLTGTTNYVGTTRIIARSGSSTITFQPFTGGGDFTVDSVSLKLATLNSEATAVADGVFDLSFTLPGSPAAGERVALWYRANGNTNYWTAYVQRNAGNTAWDFRLDSVSSGTATNRVSVTGVGTPDTIRVIVSGNDHECWTGASNVFTARGSLVTNATHATNTGVRAVYSSTVTPLRLTVYPRTSVNYNALNSI